MGRSKSRHREALGHADSPAGQAPPAEPPDLDAPPPPATTKQKLALAAMIFLMAAWLVFLAILVRK
jgi:hypothetical protein